MKFAVLYVALLSLSCATALHRLTFQVIPANPEYLLRAPDRSDTSFRETLNRYNGFVPGKAGLELRPGMDLRVENAYYKEGAPKRGLANYLGTETAYYQVGSNGALRLLSVQPMEHRPADQLAVQDLIRKPALSSRFHRFFFAVLFKKNASTRASVLLGAASGQELDRLGTQLLSDPDSVCIDGDDHCTVFPESCSASLEIEITINGEPQRVSWTSTLASVAVNSHHVELKRLYAGRLIPVRLDSADEQALRIPLLPGDRVRKE